MTIKSDASARSSCLIDPDWLGPALQVLGALGSVVGLIDVTARVRSSRRSQSQAKVRRVRGVMRQAHQAALALHERLPTLERLVHEGLAPAGRPTEGRVQVRFGSRQLLLTKAELLEWRRLLTDLHTFGGQLQTSCLVMVELLASGGFRLPDDASEAFIRVQESLNAALREIHEGDGFRLLSRLSRASADVAGLVGELRGAMEADDLRGAAR